MQENSPTVQRGPSIRQLLFLRPVLQFVQALFRKAGFKLIYAQVSGIPDAELYAPFFEPWTAADWRRRLRDGDNRSAVPLEAKYVLWTLLNDSLRNCDGDAAECGVYKGGTAVFLAEITRSAGRVLHLFDTFSGMPETDPERDLHKEGDFSDTSLESVRAYVGTQMTEYYPGTVPQTLAPLADKHFAFVHVDLDIYDAILASTEFFYSRLSPGGVIVYDDYGYASCPGARAAVDRFFEDKPEEKLVLGTGQCVVRKRLR